MEKRFTGTVVRATGSWYEVRHDGGDGPLPHAGPPASARAPFDQSGGGGRRGGVRGRRRGRLRDRRHRAAPQLRDPQGFEPFEGVAYHRRQRRSRAAGRDAARARDRHGIRGPFPGNVRGLQGPGGDPAVEDRPAGSGGRRRLPRRVRRGRLPRAGGRRAAGRRRGGGTGAARGVHDARGGQFGRRKSTLVRAIDPSLDIRTGEISESHRKGRHTTTFSAMYPSPGAGR